MDAGEVFLNCNNLTLEQYRTIVLSRALTGAGGCVVSIAVLIILLLTTKRKSWENLRKRVYLANIFYTLLYSIAAIAAVNYSHPPSQESAWCEAMGFLLHYSGTLVIVHYCALTVVVVFQVTSPVHKYKFKITKLREVFLYLVLFLCPLLNSWEPFLPQIPSYGNYGPLCWFRLELTNNCTFNTFNERFLEATPNAVLCFGCFVLTFTISLTLCGMYCKFRMKKSGHRIIRIIPTVAILTMLILVVMLWFLLSAVRSEGFGKGSFSAWLKNVTATTATTIGMLLAVGIYVHFPTHLCKQCKRAVVVRRAPHQQVPPAGESGEIKQQLAQYNTPPKIRFKNSSTDHVIAPLVPSPPKVGHRNNPRPSHTKYSNPHLLDHETTPLLPKVSHHNNPSSTWCSVPHETVTTDAVPSIPPPPNVGHCNDPPQTRSTSCHSPVATDQETARFIARPPEVSHHNDPSSTWYSVPHETVTTDAVPSIPPRPNVGHCNDPPQTRSTSRHSPATTDQETARLIAHPPEVSHHNDPSHTWYSVPHETVTTDTVPIDSSSPKRGPLQRSSSNKAYQSPFTMQSLQIRRQLN